MKKSNVVKKVSEVNAVKEVSEVSVVKVNAVSEVNAVSDFDTIAQASLQKYCLENNIAFEKSCARQVTRLMVNNEVTLNDLIKFACDFYDKTQSHLPLDKRSIWLTGRKNQNGKDTPQATLNKHITWLFSTQAIAVTRKLDKYTINYNK